MQLTNVFKPTYTEHAPQNCRTHILFRCMKDTYVHGTHAGPPGVSQHMSEDCIHPEHAFSPSGIKLETNNRPLNISQSLEINQHISEN